MLKIPELKVLVAYKTCQECTVKYSTMHLVRQYKHRKNTSCIKLLMCNKSLLIDMFVHWCIWKNCRRKNPQYNVNFSLPQLQLKNNMYVW